MRKLLTQLAMIALLGMPGLAVAVELAAKGTSVETPDGKRITFLTPEVSSRLDILRVPTRDPIPIIVGTYWQCFETDEGHESCDIVLVVCTDDQTFCTSIP